MKKTSILFICHGNTCRSAMAEFIFKDMVKQAGRENEFMITSAAVGRVAPDTDMYRAAQEALEEHGVPFTKHCAHRVTEEEMQTCDHILIMDDGNLQFLKNRFGGRYLEKVHLLLAYTGRPRDVEDPWYSHDYDTAVDEITRGCRAFLRTLPRAEGEPR